MQVLRSSYITLLAALLLMAPGCAQDRSTTAPSIGDPTLDRVDSILRAGVTSSDDQAFLDGLDEGDLARVFAYYEQHPIIADSLDAPPLEARTMAVLDAQDYVGETIEFAWGYGGWVASGWFHTSACGGDGNDHFYSYPGVPNGYGDRGRLGIRTIHPGIWATFQYYIHRPGHPTSGLSSRIYPNNNVYMCVGAAMHVFGVTHEVWRTSAHLYKR